MCTLFCIVLILLPLLRNPWVVLVINAGMLYKMIPYLLIIQIRISCEFYYRMNSIYTHVLYLKTQEAWVQKLVMSTRLSSCTARLYSLTFTRSFKRMLEIYWHHFTSTLYAVVSLSAIFSVHRDVMFLPTDTGSVCPTENHVTNVWTTWPLFYVTMTQKTQ